MYQSITLTQYDSLPPACFRCKVKKGDRFGPLTVVDTPRSTMDVVSGSANAVAKCKCKCGRVVVRKCSSLRNAKQCDRHCKANVHLTHGCSAHPLFVVWENMMKRCHNKSNKRYRDYGDRGIYVTALWYGSPEAFIQWGLANGWRRGLQIDRINNDGPYCPANCRFVTPRENMDDRRNTVRVTAFGETKTINEWVADDRCSVSRRALEARLRRWGDSELAISTPRLKNGPGGRSSVHTQ